MSLYLVVAVLVVIILCVSIVSKKFKITETSYSFIKVDSLFTPAERSFYGVLKQVIEDKAEVFAKVRVADVLMPKKGQGRSGWQIAFNKVSRKHFDFLVCKTDDLATLCAIELDDKSHQKKNRKERDDFLSSSCKSAGITLVNVKVQAGYSLPEIKSLLAEYVPGLVQDAQKDGDLALPQEQTNDVSEDCPKCSTVLVRRIAKNGESLLVL